MIIPRSLPPSASHVVCRPTKTEPDLKLSDRGHEVIREGADAILRRILMFFLKYYTILNSKSDVIWKLYSLLNSIDLLTQTKKRKLWKLLMVAANSFCVVIWPIYQVFWESGRFFFIIINNQYPFGVFLLEGGYILNETLILSTKP